MNLGPFAKAVIGTVFTFGLAVDTAQPGGIEAAEWIAIAVATVASAVGIFYVVNGGGLGRYAKAVAAFLTTALGVVAAGVADGWAGLTWSLVLSAVVKAAVTSGLVSQTPNAQESDNLIVQDADDTEHVFLVDSQEAENEVS